MSATLLYSAQISRPALIKWTKKLPREVGGAIIAEAVSDLMHGDCSSLKSLPFVSRCNLRRKRKLTRASTPPTITTP